MRFKELDIPKCMLTRNQNHPAAFMERQIRLILEDRSQSQEQQEISRQHCLARHALMQEKQKYIWNRMFPSDEYRRKTGIF